MSDEQQSGQAQTPDRHTLGNAIPDYTTAPTRKPFRNGHLPEIALQVVLGNLPFVLTPEHTALVRGCPGVSTCLRILAYFTAHHNAQFNTAVVSDISCASDLVLTRPTVNKAKNMLMQVGLMRDTGKKWGKGCKVYDFPWFDEQINEPFAVLKSTHIQHSTEQVQNTTLQTETKSKPQPTAKDPFMDLWESVIADLPSEMKSALNYKQARPTFIECLANGWDKYPEQLKDQVMKRHSPGLTEPGWLVNVLKEITLIKPSKPIIKCDYDNCNGNMHESVENQQPYRCPKKVQPF